MEHDQDLQHAPTEKAPAWSDVASASAEQTVIAGMEDRETFKHACRLKLTPEELSAKAEELDVAIKNTDALALKKKAAAKAFKLANDEMAELSREVASQHHDVEIDCYERKIFDTNTIDIVRADTGEVVESRSMNANERQREMFPGKDAGPVAHEGDEDAAPDSDDDTAITDPESLSEGTAPKKRTRKAKGAEA